MKKWFGRLLASLLCLCLSFGGVFALGEATDTPTATVNPDGGSVSQDAQSGDILEDPGALSGTDDAAAQADTDTAQYVATATVTLKVRRSPNLDAAGNSSIAKGEMVYILELGNDWCKVDSDSSVGYVQTKYLTDIREYSASQGATASPIQTGELSSGAASANSATVVNAVSPMQPTMFDAALFTPEGFKENFKAEMYKAAVARKGMDEHSGGVFSIKMHEEVTVSAYQGDWSYIRYKNSYGYVLTSVLFKWDRIDAYAGYIPGAVQPIGLAFVNKSTLIKSYADNGKKTLKTVNAGSAIMVESLDNLGRYSFPYWRTTGYIDQSDVGYVMKVVPWETAQSGDMISCTSTFYAVGIHTLQYQGRNYNIYLGTSFISGTILQPEESVNIYDVMGPYRKSTGYHHAPIMSAGALWGYGGGVCQVNTTLYNALIEVPILINWRKVHADVGIYYCPVGFDAAVGGGDITMIFTNKLPYAVRINYFMSDGCLTVGIFRV